MEEDFKEAFYEVNEILKTMPKEMLEKIPNKFKELVDENKSNTYNKKIDGLNNLDSLKKETIVILGYIYRDFLCDEEEKKKIIENEKKELEKLYSYDNLFKQSIEEKKEDECISKELVKIEKNKWYMNIVRFFREKFYNRQ